MGRTRGFAIDWPVTIHVEDGRTFIVELAPDDNLWVRVDGSDERRSIDPSLYGFGVPSEGAVVGRTLRWWHETTGEPVAIAPSRRS
jgi:hypothetical protein